MTLNLKHSQGFSFIEILMFVVLLGILASGLFSLHGVNTGSAVSQTNNQARQLAIQRSELIVAQRRLQSFAALADPCVGGSPPAMCVPPAGFNVSAVITPNWLGDTNYNVITVTVSGNGDASLTTMVADY